MKILISEEQIKSLVKNLATTVTQMLDLPIYATKKPHYVCVLNGAFMFFSDIVKLLPEGKISFVKVSATSSGKVIKERIIRASTPLKIEEDEVVILIDTIFDTGKTLKALKEQILVDYFFSTGDLEEPDVLFVTLVNREATAKPDCLISGISISKDLWIYGYGTDNAEGKFRNLTDIVV